MKKQLLLRGTLGAVGLGVVVAILTGAVGLDEILTFTILGLVTGSAYAIASSGLVITYATSNVFNMAHGAVGMVMAFVFWELSSNRGLPTWLALLLTVGVIAPLFGALLERTMMRRLTNASVTASLTVTVGLFVMLIGIAQAIWPPAARRVDAFFPGHGLTLFGVFVTAHQILTFVVAGVVAIGLYVLLNRTRTGIAMRAIVDNRELLSLHGARPQLLGMLSWALGSALAALAGILLVPIVQLDYFTLTLIVINAYAAAMVGRLKNLPRTFVGAIVLGLSLEYFRLFIQKLPGAVQDNYADLLQGLRASLPTIFLFVTMLLLPQIKLRVGVVEGASLARLPDRKKAIGWGVALVLAVALVTQFLTTANIAALGKGLAFALIMLSLVLLTGYGGDVSLSQMSFVGVGALVVVKIGVVNPISILLAGAVAAIVGAIIAFPALRLRGLYIGLGTLALAVAMDKLVFESDTLGFKLGGIAEVARPGMFESERAFAILVAVAFALMGYFVLAIRRGRFGRLLLATRDSPAACGTLGLSITQTRVAVFAMSAGLAGIAGAFFAGMVIAVGAADFAMFQSLPLLLMAAVGGLTSITGALIGGLLLGLGPALQDAFSGVSGMNNITIGFIALFATNPNGVAGVAFNAVNKLLGRDTSVTSAVVEDDESTAGEVSAVAAS